MQQTLWTPSTARRAAPKVAQPTIDRTRAWEQNVLGQMHATGGVMDHWNPELQKIDRNLFLMQASEHADVAGVIPGFYHLIRLRDSAENTFMMVQPLRGPNDEFVEPSSAMLDALRACDLQNDRVLADIRKQNARTTASAERAKANDDEDRLAEGMERFKAVTRTQVLMSPDVPWSQNNSANARRARGDKSKG